MKIIVPCGGRSSRYPNMPPKWILPDHKGIPMVVRAVEQIECSPKDIVITILREHEDRFNARKGLSDAFGHDVTCLVLDEPTRSQSETVAVTLDALGIDEPFLVKDSDNSFSLANVDETENYVSVASLNDFDAINPRNKSYVTIDQEDFITGIREKRVISDLFSVGGYFFRSPDRFLQAFETLRSTPNVDAHEIYISEVISYLLMQGDLFKVKKAIKYQDWGTVHEWRRKLEERRLYFVNIDGFLFQRGSSHFSPTFDEVAGNDGAISAICKLCEAGHRVIYLSIRPQELEAMTLAALKNAGLPEGKLLMECDIGQWMLVTSPEPSIPLSTSVALEILPADANLVEKLQRTI
jgi:NDP-sugar pyrophosphorylase family protein